jgi:phage-related protein
MPKTEVRIYRSQSGAVPLLDWLDRLPEKVRLKCLARVERLRELGHELRRPEADFLQDGIYELRVKRGRVNYRILYFYHGKEAVLSHGLTKEDRVPDREIKLAIRRMKEYRTNPEDRAYAI